MRSIPERIVPYLGGKIGSRITLLFSIVILLFVLFSCFNQAFQQQFSSQYEKSNRKLEIARNLRENVTNSQKSMMQYLRSGNIIYYADYQELAAETETLIGEAQDSLDGENTRFLLPGIRFTNEAFARVCAEASTAYQNKDNSYYTLMYEMQNVYRYLNEYCEELLQASMEESTQHYGNWETARRKMLPWNVFLIFSLIVLFLGAVIYITEYITQPLDQLVGAARKVSEGDLDIQFPLPKQDNEVSLLGQTFQQMVSNIEQMLVYEKEKADTEKALLEEQRKNEEYKKVLEQTRFLALQSQTNPHFMFNTLNSIKSTILTGKQEQALAMLDSFAALMRYNLKSADTEVSLREELLITKEYMKIQKIRFGDRINFHMRIDETLLEQVTIPRFTLQPLVENAIIHGLEKKVEQGYVMIDAGKRREQCILRVFDDGVGMTEERLNEVLFQNFQGEKRIGIENIRKRIAIFTGSKDNFRLISKRNLGTLVLIRLKVASNNSSL